MPEQLSRKILRDKCLDSEWMCAGYAVVGAIVNPRSAMLRVDNGALAGVAAVSEQIRTDVVEPILSALCAT
jgi:hypothetical protein